VAERQWVFPMPAQLALPFVTGQLWSGISSSKNTVAIGQSVLGAAVGADSFGIRVSPSAVWIRGR
jgi:hypothetical protein